MRTYIGPLSSALVLALSLPALAQERTVTVAPSDENVAEANVFMNAKVIAIRRDRDQIEIRDNDGKRKTLALAEDATIPQGGLKAGSDVLLSVREKGRRAGTVVAVQPTAPATRGGRRSSANINTQPLYLPGRENGVGGLEQEAVAQGSYQSGVVSAPSTAGVAGPQFLAGGAVVDPRLVGTNGLATNANGTTTATSGTLGSNGTVPVSSGGIGTPGFIGPSPGTTTLTGPVAGTTTQSTVSPGATTIIGDDTNAQVRTTPVMGTTLQTGALAGAPNTIGAPSNTVTLNGPVAGTTIQSSALPQNPAITGQTAPLTTLGSTSSTTRNGRTATGGVTSTFTAPTASLSTGVTGPSVRSSTVSGSVGSTAANGIVTTSALGTTPVSGTTFTNSDLAARSRVTTFGSSPAMASGSVVAAGTGAPFAATGSTGAAATSSSAQAAQFTGVAGPVIPLGSAAVQFGSVGSSPTIGSPATGGGIAGPSATDTGGLGADAVPLPTGRAVQAYEASMARLSVKADEVDAAFARYREACVGLDTPTANLGTRTWLGIWNGSTVPAETRDQCEPLLSAALRLGEQVKRGMRTADDMARKSGVLPGITRQIRTQYNMDWPGWDQ
jgi:hypothetical protein